MDSQSSHTDAGSGGDTAPDSIRERIEQQEESGSTISVFQNPELVDPNTIIDADRIVGRDQQLDDIIANLRPAIRGNRPPNMLLYGPSGTGKSLIIHAVGEEINGICQTRDVDFGIVSLNCQMVDTLDRAIYELCVAAGESVGEDLDVPSSGISTKDKLNRLYEFINQHYDVVLFVLDEIDYLKGKGNSTEPAYSKLLYQLSRAGIAGDIDGQCSVTALTNDPQFMERLDGRADSSFNPDNISFDDYNATQIQEILKHRKDAFRPDALDEDVIPLTAAFAAQSHGDARKAIDLIRKAGEIADRNDANLVIDDHVREAQDVIEVDRTRDLLSGLSLQKQVALYATAATAHYGDTSPVPSRPGYSVYQWITEETGVNEMTRETYVKYMNKLGSYGLLTAKRKGRGQGRGMISVFSLSRSPSTYLESLEEEPRLGDLNKDALKEVVRREVRAFH